MKGGDDQVLELVRTEIGWRGLVESNPFHVEETRFLPWGGVGHETQQSTLPSLASLCKIILLWLPEHERNARDPITTVFTQVELNLINLAPTQSFVQPQAYGRCLNIDAGIGPVSGGYSMSQEPRAYTLTLM